MVRKGMLGNVWAPHRPGQSVFSWMQKNKNVIHSHWGTEDTHSMGPQPVNLRFCSMSNWDLSSVMLGNHISDQDGGETQQSHRLPVYKSREE